MVSCFSACRMSRSSSISRSFRPASSIGDELSVTMALRRRLRCLNGRRFHEDPAVALVPRPAGVDLAMIAGAGGIVEELIDQSRRRRDAADAERRLAHAFERQRERLHVGDFAGHQELQRVLGAGVVAEIDQPLVDDLGARFGRDVAAQVDVEFAGDLQIIGGPGVALRIEQIHAAAAGDRDQRVGLGGLPVELHRLEVHARQRADDFKMAQLLGADVHQQVLAVRILAIEPLDRILHGGREFAVGAAELLQQHIAEARIGFVDADGVHQFFDVVIHGMASKVGMMSPERWPLCFVPKTNAWEHAPASIGTAVAHTGRRDATALR